MATKKTTSKTQSKSDFIRQQPSTMSAAEVVAKAKSEAVKIDPALVYKVRRTTKAKKGTAKKTSMAKPTAIASNKPLTSKADFVRRFPTLSPKELVAKAKAGGIKLDAGYVYNVRGGDKAAAKKKREATKANSKPAATNGTRPSITTTSSSKAEALLKALGAELGLGRAIEILAGERARVRAVIGG